jgi:predicted TIM-barrel fold metal-dependent hydrolase
MGAVLLLLGLLAVGLFTGRSRELGLDRDPRPRQAAPTALPPQPLKVVDVHVHLSLGAVGRLEKLMRSYGFHHAVNLSGGHPLGRLEEQIAAARTSGKRMARVLEMAHAQGAKGLKIAKALGLGLVGPDGKLIAVDDPGLDPVFEKAGELGMPVAIHAGDPEAFWLPIDERNERRAELTAHPGWSLYGEKVPTFDEILNQLERRIARHPKTKFISVHFGNCAEHPDRVARMLRTYPNLYIDTAARIPEMGRHPADRMRAFFIEFQDRILYGSDLGVGPEPTPLFLGSSGAEPPTRDEELRFFSASRRYFETGDRQFEHPTPIQGEWKIDGINLPRDVLKKVYAENAAKLLGIQL